MRRSTAIEAFIVKIARPPGERPRRGGLLPADCRSPSLGSDLTAIITEKPPGDRLSELASLFGSRVSCRLQLKAERESGTDVSHHY